MEQLLKQKDRENAEMNVIITGLKRQLGEEGESVNSSIEANAKL